MADKYKRADKPYKYIAARLGGPMEPLPHWFKYVLQLRLMRINEDGNVEVQLITGAWSLVMPGDWVVLQKGDEKFGRLPTDFMVWHVEHEDFIKLWEAV